MIEVHLLRRRWCWWAYTRNDNGVVTHAAWGLSATRARNKLYNQFIDADRVDQMVLKKENA